MATRWMIAFEGFKQIHTLLSTQLVRRVRGNRFASVGLFIERKKSKSNTRTKNSKMLFTFIKFGWPGYITVIKFTEFI